MSRHRLAIVFGCAFYTLAAVISISSTAATKPQPVANSAAGLATGSAADEEAVWKLEHDYWRYVEANDLTSYRALWHERFIGWPSVSAAPVSKANITDWITSQTSKGMTFKLVEMKQAAIQITVNVAETYYWITDKWVDKNGAGANRKTRVTHSWVRNGDGGSGGSQWHILGGMSSSEAEQSQK